jgi:hypothetical protein
MTTAQKLQQLLKSGYHRIGEIELQTDLYGYPYALCHQADVELSTEPAFGGLEIHHGPAAARDLSTYAEDGTYRFTKGQVNLKRGWVMVLESVQDLRLALDQFYPACLGLFLAQQDGSLEIETLREKLNRQTGMYRFARSISDAGAQQLVQTVCGPARQENPLENRCRHPPRRQRSEPFQRHPQRSPRHPSHPTALPGSL